MRDVKLDMLSFPLLPGDQEQLRPKTEVYELSVASRRGYNLDVSLFERLIADVNFPVHTLTTQRRMAPAISNLVRQTVYPTLQDAPNVTRYGPVPGMVHNLFFWDHDHPEKSRDAESKSFANRAEAERVVGLVAYLLRQVIYRSPGSKGYFLTKPLLFAALTLL